MEKLLYILSYSRIATLSRQINNLISYSSIKINLGFKARFHYERRIEHSLFLLLIFPRLKLKRALSEAKNQLNKQEILFSLLVVETGL